MTRQIRGNRPSVLQGSSALRTSLVIALSIAALVGCTANGGSSSSSSGESEPQALARQTIPAGYFRDPITLRPIQITPFADYAEMPVSGMSQDTLGTLLLAEVSGQRGDLPRLLSDYTAVALETKDPGIIKRAFEAAQYLKDDDAALALATLWTDVEPDSLEANQHVAVYQLKSGEFATALLYMERVMELGGQSTFDRLALHLATLDSDTQDRMLALYAQLIDRHPDEPSLHFGRATLLAHRLQFGEAFKESAYLIKRYPEETNYIALHSKLMQKQLGADAALAYLRKEHKRLSENLQIGVLFGQALLEEERFDEAEKLYESLMEQHPDVPTLKRSFAIIALQNERLPMAKQALEALLAEDKLTNDAHYYLGRIADQQNNVETAIFHYAQVQAGGNFITALARSAFLLRQVGRPDEAAQLFSSARTLFPDQSESIWQVEISLYNETGHYEEALASAENAVRANPESAELKYSYAMTADKAGKLDVLERELREIIEVDADNAVALNALGYTLADRTDRLQEAESLITRALELEPSNPAILDSFGWLQYRLGNLPEALSYLERAYSAFPDPEVAAHFGEVLWESGQQDRARQIWQEGIDQDKDHVLLNETMKRLGVTPGSKA